ncbi:MULTISPECIES: hypothetical protein [Enterobacterales]|uniref:WapI family immunity protein n=1 Tax=Enterobacterales TaxID=91347 RepID=UPI002ED877CB
MLQIIHNEITLAITPYEKLINTPEKGFYHEWLNSYVEFSSRGISLNTKWDCYVGELEEFHAQLIKLRDNNIEDEIIFSPMDGMITLAVGKNIQPDERYYLKFKLSTEVHSDIYVEGTIGMDQTYIHEFIQGVYQLIRY